ncbi:MAG: hypothetical protein WCI25_09415, partial [Actinomycetes bacterium]
MTNKVMARIRFAGCFLVFAVVFFPEIAQAAGFFGALAAQETAVTVTISSATVPVGGSATATGGGGSGTGAYSFDSGTPIICTVNATSGLIQTLSAGSCAITATRAGSDVYAPSTSSPTYLSVTTPVVAPPATPAPTVDPAA